MSRLILLAIGIMVSVVGVVKPGTSSGKQSNSLIKAMKQRDLTTVRHLLKQGRKVDSKDSQGRADLLVAVAATHIDMADS